MMHPIMLAFGSENLFLMPWWLPMPWLQIPGLIVLIGLIVFWVIYRRRQM